MTTIRTILAVYRSMPRSERLAGIAVATLGPLLFVAVAVVLPN